MKKLTLHIPLSLILAVALLLAAAPVSFAAAEDMEERCIQYPAMENGFTVGLDLEGLTNPEVTYTWYTKALKPLSEIGSYTITCGTQNGDAISSETDEWEWDIIAFDFGDLLSDNDQIYYKVNGVERHSDWMFDLIFFEPTTITDVRVTADEVIPGETAATLSSYTTNSLYRCEVTINGETLYGRWEKAGYVLYYDSGEGYLSYREDRYSTGDEITVEELEMTKNGYRFFCWNTEEDGNGTDYAPGSTCIMGTSDIILHAVWAPVILGQPTPLNRYTVTLDPYYTAPSYQWCRLITTTTPLSEMELDMVFGTVDGDDVTSEDCDGDQYIALYRSMWSDLPSYLSFEYDGTLEDIGYELVSHEGSTYTYELQDREFSFLLETETPFTLSNVRFIETDAVNLKGETLDHLQQGEKGERYYCWIEADQNDTACSEIVTCLSDFGETPEIHEAEPSVPELS